jgi:hypothetical protein
MRNGKWKIRIRTFLFIGVILCLGTMANGDIQKQASGPMSGSGKTFLYTAKKFGVPILRASIKIDNGSLEQGRPIYHIQAEVNSLDYTGFLFRMNNRFTSTVEAETCSPIRYVKEINQEGLLIEKKNYLQILTFDYPNKKMVIERTEMREKQEIPLQPGTYDPLSMFARCYLKEELRPGEDIRMSIYDGVRLRQMVFHSKKEKVKPRGCGEVEVICLESVTPFSTFGDKEGIIRIWYTADGKKIPISLELDLSIGSIKFELEELKES